MSAPLFKVGQQAFVKAKFFCSTRPSAKLSDKFLGPFDIIAQTGSHSVTLRLPDTIHGVHPIFHVSMLEPATPNKIPNRTHLLRLSNFKENSNTKFQKSSIPRLIVVVHVNSYI